MSEVQERGDLRSILRKMYGRIDHPILAGMVFLSMLLLLMAFAADWSGADTWAGFLAIYSVLTLATAGIGYVAFLILRLASQYARRRQRARVRR